MKTICRVLVLIMCGIFFYTPSYAESNKKKKVAVYQISNNIQAGYKKVIGSNIVSEITDNNRYIAVERTSDFLSALNRETDYQMSGAVQDSQIVEIGQQFGVDYVVAVDITELFDELFISARLINIQNGQIENAVEGSGSVNSIQELKQLSRDIATKLMRTGSVEFSKTPVETYCLSIKNASGLRFFVSKDDYYEINGILPPGYTKEGIYICGFGNRSYQMIIPLFDSFRGCMQWNEAVNRYCNLPTKDTSFMMDDQILNNALELFGGERMKGIYWTKTPIDADNAHIIICGEGGANCDKNNCYKVREIFEINLR